jgi:hypothetical protein
MVEGYGYTRPSGLVRTPYASGRTRQRRQWRNGFRQATVSFDIDRGILGDVERFISLKGYEWFSMGLITGDNVSSVLETHTVRIIGNPSKGNVYGSQMTLSLKIEIAS